MVLEQSLSLIDGALKAAGERGFRPMAITVLDAAGVVVAQVRQEGVSELRMEIATGKAGAAIGMGMSTRALAEKAAKMPLFFNSIAAAASRPFVPQTGGVPIADAEGRVIGAAGASGGTGDEDEWILLAGIQAAGLYPA